MTGFIPESDEVLEQYTKLLRQIPSQEPSNGGPTHSEFADALDVVAKTIVERPNRRNPFPDPLLTATAGYQTKK